jgi:hypothetical protein
MAGEDMRAVFQRILGDAGLGDMTNFLDNAVVNNWGPDRFQAEFLDTPQFNQAFPEYKGRIKANKPPMTPGEILQYRSSARELMKNAGLPTSFYADNSHIAELMIQDVSAAELQKRITNGFQKVATAPAEVKAAFNDFFGANGDGALASLFLDPAQGFEQAKAIRPFTEETISETEDLTSQDAVNAVFGDDQTNSKERIQRRQQERTAAFQGGGGAAAQQTGLGLGEAR